VNPRTAYEAIGNAALWSEDLYFRTADAFQTTRNATEEITAGYVQGQAKFGRLGVLGGVRSEKTDVSGFGYVRVAPATAAQIPDPVARAQRLGQSRKQRRLLHALFPEPSSHLRLHRAPAGAGELVHVVWPPGVHEPRADGDHQRPEPDRDDQQPVGRPAVFGKH
jgi:hypothetical protein